jgi:beta-N-acetylglucosaminidase
MSPLGLHAVRGRVAAAVLTTVLVAIPVIPAAAAGDPAGQVSQAQQQLRSAQQQAQQADSALGAAQQDLATAQAQLAALDKQVAGIDAQIAADDAQAAQLDRQTQQDKAQLATVLRASYVRGMDSPLLYVISASDLTSALQRQGDLSHVADASKQLMLRIANARAAVQKAHDDATAQRAQLDVAKQQAAATAVLVSIEEQKLADQSSAAHVTVAQSQQQLQNAVNAKKAFDAEQARLALERQRQQQQQQQASAPQKSTGPVFSPVAGVQFTIDTDLTQPSGETAARLNAFLQGTALANLGDAFMAAEQSYHVSARYLLAHAIEESAFGTSRIAHDKHNLFGYGADDAHPYEDAYTFASFAACIDFVAHMVAKNYLSPSGAYYHGPTLRGMNVTYASDPRWADNIARIARSFP